MNNTKISAKTAAGIMSNLRTPSANTRQRCCEPSKFGYGRNKTPKRNEKSFTGFRACLVRNKASKEMKKGAAGK